MIYRQEHPKPQFQREGWVNLNGHWEFEFDHGGSGIARKMYGDEYKYSKKINVPFCPQSKLSGIEYKDFLRAVWYRRSFELTKEQLSGKVYIHFGTVDYFAAVYINGKKCGSHKGGYVSFRIDITDHVHEGENTVCLLAEDDERNRLIPCGKQSHEYYSCGCDYTRTTGIWQTVWLEFTPKIHVEKIKLYPSLSSQSVTVRAKVMGCAKLTVSAYWDGRPMGSASALSDGEEIILSIPLFECHPWELGKGGLYDLVITYGEDRVKSYFGLRSIDYRDYKFYLNGKSVFQRLVLDQGFNPDGIYTAPSDAELIADIDRALAMGFNGARLHEKVFEERFLYHADRKGYLVWGEYPNWGLDHTYSDSVYGILAEWLEEVDRDFNHPSIVGWCPFNETWDQNGRKQFDDCLALVYHATKAADPTRPCIDTSGNYHVVTDIYDVHQYEQDPEKFKSFYEPLKDGGQPIDHCGHRQKYDGAMPFFVSEYGGIRWTEDKGGWGYGNAPQSENELLSRLKGLTDVLLDHPMMFGLCYTQLTDVEQEQNGLYTYDRKAKFPPELIYPIFSRKAKSEE